MRTISEIIKSRISLGYARYKGKNILRWRWESERSREYFFSLCLYRESANVIIEDYDSYRALTFHFLANCIHVRYNSLLFSAIHLFDFTFSFFLHKHFFYIYVLRRPVQPLRKKEINIVTAFISEACARYVDCEL